MSASADADARELEVALMRADLGLKTKQSFWETPKGVAAVVAATAVVVGTITGLLGYQIGAHPAQPVQVIFQPGAIAGPK